MKKFLTYFLLVTYLFSFTEMNQVLKLPNLVEHYISHTIKDKNTTLFSFLKMHYWDAPVKDADYSQDMKLPFKKHDFSVVSINLTTPPKALEFSSEDKKLFTEKKSNFGYSEPFTTPNISAVFRPPILG